MILHVQSDTLVSETESIAPPKKRCKLCSFMGDGDASVKQQGDNYSLASIQLRNYLTQPNIPEDHDPLQYWKQNKQTMPEPTTLALLSSTCFVSSYRKLVFYRWEGVSPR